VLVALACTLAFATSAAAQRPSGPLPQTAVGDVGTHDPSLVIRGGTPKYAVFSTHNQVRYSADRTVWALGPPALDPVPAWTNQYSNNDLWAPDVSYHRGRYWMYYSASTTGSQHSAIGLATSLTGEPGSWVDKGEVIVSRQSDPNTEPNAIDPALLVDDDGRWWLTFGSYFGGIYVLELDPSTGLRKAGASPIRIADRSSIEGAYTFKRGGYYYLFLSFGSCCPALIGAQKPTYEIWVARSTSITGPYTNKTGHATLDGHAEPVLGERDHVAARGGQSVVHDPNTGRDLLVYHWYDSRLNYASFLGINNLRWENGWPVAE
jgi:arabinan endo-1,5-alpha-L-arabinosidase